MTESTPEKPLLVAPEKPTIRRNASWGVIISIIIILLMITVGAFYAWGQRLEQIRAVQSLEHSNSQQ